MTIANEAAETTAVETMTRVSAIKFWRTLHAWAVTAMAGVSDSQFAALEGDMGSTAFRDEPWMPHLEAVMHDAARVRRSLS